MSTIDRLIFDALAQHRSVVLWGVGTLEVRRRKAKKISDTRIIPPQNVVKFTPEEHPETTSVVDMLVATGGADLDEARTLYESWLEGARSGDGSDATIRIDGAGEIKDGRFVVARTLHSALNPEKEDIITMEKKGKSCPGSLWSWVLNGVLVLLLVAMALWCWKKGVFTCGPKDDPTEQIVEFIDMPDDAATADSLASADDMDSGMDMTADDVAPAAQDASTDGASTTAATTASTTSTTATTATAASGKTAYHVIAGVFSIPGNADNLAAKIRKEHSELKVSKLINPANGYTMVSIYSAPTERQAYNTMDHYWDIDLYLWVYKQN